MNQVNSNEYLKVLKETKINLEKLKDEIVDDNFTLKGEYQKDKRRYIIKSISSAILLVLSYQNQDVYYTFSNLLKFLIVAGIIELISIEKCKNDYVKEFEDAYDLTRKYNIEIEKINNVIKFIKNTDEEELTQFLNYKNNLS